MDKSKQEKIKQKILDYLEQGAYKKDAALMSGISEKTFYRWLEEDDSFDSRVEASILCYKYSLIKTLNLQAKNNGTLALKILQTRWPSDWSVSPLENRNESSTQEIAMLIQQMLDQKDGKVAHDHEKDFNPRG